MIAENIEFFIFGESLKQMQGLLDVLKKLFSITGVLLSGAVAQDFSAGGSGIDAMLGGDATSDGGVMIVGQSNSVDGSKTSPHFGDFDAWVVKFDANDNQIWDVSLGGTERETPQRLRATPDGGGIIAGSSRSGISGNKTSANQGGNDAWVVKLDANGNIEWQASYGGDRDDVFIDAIPTADGGYLFGGISASTPGTGNKTAPRYGLEDAWIVKVDAAGAMQWDQTYGGTHFQGVIRLQATSDGGYLAAGDSTSVPGGTKTAPSYSPGDFDFWVFKIDHAGNQLWDVSFGGSSSDSLRECTPTRDGGFLIGGRSRSPSNGNKTATHYGDWDYWLIKIDQFGNKLWERSYGGSGDDRMFEIIEAADCGSYFLGGLSSSNLSGTKQTPSFGNIDFWLVRIDLEGNPISEAVYGGTSGEALVDIALTPDRGYVLIGGSSSPPSGNKIAPQFGQQDYWYVRLAPEPTVLELLALNAGLEAELAATQAELADCEVEKQQAEQQVVQLQAQLANCEATKQQLEQQVQQLEDALDALGTENAGLIAVISQLQAELAELESMIAQLEESLGTDIPGETLEENVSALSNGISGLPPGQKKNLFK